MNYLWGIMIVVGVVYGALNGTLAEVTEQALASAKDAVTLCLTMAGVMAFWMGMMEIAEDTGLIRRLTRGIAPLLSFLFPSLPADHPARPYIATNVIANVFGLGWAATPAGLEAMKALKESEDIENLENLEDLETNKLSPFSTHRSFNAGKKRSPSAISAPEDGCATDSMCDFLILNISSLQLIPINIITYRTQYGSDHPTSVIGPAILATLCSTGTAVLFIRLHHRFRR